MLGTQFLKSPISLKFSNLHKIPIPAKIKVNPAWGHSCESHGLRPVVHFFTGTKMSRQRVISLIDGFNLYHAIADLKRPELKWVDLWALSKSFLKTYSEELTNVFYFSAYADHISESVLRCQTAYVQALELRAVKPIMGYFKKKYRKCTACDYKWFSYHEKETDVNIALFLLDLAFKNAFDRALVITNDSDLAPAIRMVRDRFPEKRITTVAPPHSVYNNELIKASSDKTKIRIEHLERCLLPLVVSDRSGLISVSRPHEYMPAAKIYAGSFT